MSIYQKQLYIENGCLCSFFSFSGVRLTFWTPRPKTMRRLVHFNCINFSNELKNHAPVIRASTSWTVFSIQLGVMWTRYFSLLTLTLFELGGIFNGGFVILFLILKCPCRLYLWWIRTLDMVDLWSISIAKYHLLNSLMTLLPRIWRQNWYLFSVHWPLSVQVIKIQKLTALV